MNAVRLLSPLRLAALGVIAGLAASCGSGHASSNQPGPITLSALTVTPASVPLGVAATGRVTLTKAASSATVVSLSASTNAVSVPSSVTIGSGSSAVDFSIATLSVGTPIITATLGSETRTAGVNVLASTVPVLSSITTASGTVVGGNSVQGTATLTLPAGTGGAVVTLSSNRAQAAVPASITIPAGATSATFTITTTSVATATTATISGVYAGVTQTATLNLTPPTLSAAFTVQSNPPPSPAVTNSCPLAPSGTALNCTFDGSASTGSISSYQWTYSVPSHTLTQTTTTATLTNPPVTCGFFTGVGTTTSGTITMTVSLVVVDSSGTASPTATNANVSITPPMGTCGF